MPGGELSTAPSTNTWYAAIRDHHLTISAALLSGLALADLFRGCGPRGRRSMMCDSEAEAARRPRDSDLGTLGRQVHATSLEVRDRAGQVSPAHQEPGEISLN